MAKIAKPRSSKGLATFCARIAEDKIARDILILNLSKIEVAPSDFFVLCTCDSDVQVSAIVDAIMRQCKNAGISRPRAEGLEGNFWVLLDFFDVVVHIMQKDAREYYKLEKLWGDAQFYKLDDELKPKKIDNTELKQIIG